MILWSKTAQKLAEPAEVETTSLKAKPEPFTAPDLVIMGWKKKNTKKRSELLSFKDKFDILEFKAFCRRAKKIQILQRLIDFTKIRLFSYKPYRVRRARKFGSPRPGHKCVACGCASEVLHHVIMICHGGPNRSSNIVDLCNACHAEVHPWLKDKL